jgi:hypothetical protein
MNLKLGMLDYGLVLVFCNMSAEIVEYTLSQ